MTLSASFDHNGTAPLTMNGDTGGATTNGVSGTKAARAMLPRGAACDLCRSRKVKCDGLQPVCSQCTKSARGRTEVINCVYDGGAAARQGSAKKSAKIKAAAAALAGPSTLGPNIGAPLVQNVVREKSELPAKVKRKREGSEEDSLDGRDGDDVIAFNGEKKRKEKPTQRVEVLVDRITELERRLRDQQPPMPVSVYTHARASASPPFHTAYLPGSGSTPMDYNRRSMSYSGEGSSLKDITASWTAESSVRFTGRNSEIDMDLKSGPQSGNHRNGNGGAYSPGYASFIPSYEEPRATPGKYADFYPPSSSSLPLPPISHLRPLPPPPPPAGAFFPNSSSYPPLNYNSSPYVAESPSYFNHNQIPRPLLPLGGVSSRSPSDMEELTGDFTPSTSNSNQNSPEAAFSLDASLLQILYPGWPTSLPLPTTVNHLISVFFARAQVPSSMFDKPKLLLSLDLPPTNHGFPHTALLHAILAYASIFVSEETLAAGMDRKGKYWDSEGSPRVWHYKKAREEIEKGVLKTGSGKMFQILQATILCSYIAYQSASFTELWLLSGLATRLCTPLGLNHLPPWDFDTSAAGTVPTDWQGRIRNTPSLITHSILAPPSDFEEYRERAATFWAAFAVDRFSSASTDWSTSIDELDIGTHIPCVGPAPVSATSLKHKDFLHSPAAPIGSMGLYIKAVVLLGRVVNYLQRLPRYQAMPEGETCNTIRAKFTAAPEFVELDFALSKFRTSMSGDFFNAGSNVDGHLASAYAIPHAASILLHEPFCDRDDKSDSSSIARCLTSAKCVVNSTYVLFHSSNDLSGIDPFLPYCWSVVGRALVRDFAVKSYWGETQQASFSKQLAEHVLLFTSSCNTRGGVPVASVMTGALQKLLDDPFKTLPFNEQECEESSSWRV